MLVASVTLKTPRMPPSSGSAFRSFSFSSSSIFCCAAPLNVCPCSRMNSSMRSISSGVGVRCPAAAGGTPAAGSLADGLGAGVGSA